MDADWQGTHQSFKRLNKKVIVHVHDLYQNIFPAIQCPLKTVRMLNKLTTSFQVKDN